MRTVEASRIRLPPLLALLCASALAACASAPTAGSQLPDLPAPPEPSAGATVEGDDGDEGAEADEPPAVYGTDDGEGADCDSAVVIEAPNTVRGIAAENRWILARYPDARKIGQYLMSCGDDRMADGIRIVTPDGVERVIVLTSPASSGRSEDLISPASRISFFRVSRSSPEGTLWYLRNDYGSSAPPNVHLGTGEHSRAV